MIYLFLLLPVTVLAGIACAWFYGIGYLRGFDVGCENGRARADAEWAVWAEHGAL